MAPNTAVAVLLARALLLLPPTSAQRPYPGLLGLGHTVVLVLATVPLLGYALGLTPARHWPGFPAMAAPTALGLLTGAAAGLAVLLGAQRARRPRSPSAACC